MTRNTSSMPMDVADLLLRDVEPDPAERFRFWLLTHGSAEGERFWRAVVLRECTPDPEQPGFGRT